MKKLLILFLGLLFILTTRTYAGSVTVQVASGLTADNIKSLISAAVNDGNTDITLQFADGGTWGSSTSNLALTVPAGVTSLTFYSANDATSATIPTLYLGALTYSDALMTGGIKFQGVKLVTVIGNIYLIQPSSSNATYIPASVIFDNCWLQGYRAMFYSALATSTSDIQFQNCIIKNIAASGIINVSTGSISRIIIRNNTFINVGANFSGASTDYFVDFRSSNSITSQITFSHNTVVYPSVQGRGLFRLSTTAFSTGYLHYNSNLFACGSTTALTLAMTYNYTTGVLTEGSGTDSTNYYALNFTAVGSKPTTVIATAYAAASPTLFEDPSNDNLRIKDASFPGKISCGAPRWYYPSAITLSTSSLTGFVYTSGNGPSTPLSFTVSAVALKKAVSVQAPADYEISLDNITYTGSSLTIGTAGSDLASTLVYVRLKAGLAEAAYNNESITISTPTATTQTVACSGNVVGNVPMLSAPTSIVGASPTYSGFNASWTSVDNALSYNVTVYAGGSVVSSLMGIASSTVDITGLTSGTVYTFTVTAVGDGTNYINSAVSSSSNAVKVLERNLYTSVNVTGAGTVSKSPNVTNYSENASVQLTATRGFGYQFVNWADSVSGTVLSTANPYTLTMDVAKHIRAVFTPMTTYSVSATATAGGSVSISPTPTNGQLEIGATATLTATKSFGYKFVEWRDANTDALLSSANPYSFNVSADIVLKAVFATVNTYSLTLNTVGAPAYMVKVTPAGTTVNGQSMYEEGTAISLTAGNNSILTFTNWDDAQTNPVRSLTMSQNQSVTASYSVKSYIVGWDFYVKGGSNRVADFASTTINASSTLSMRNTSGTVSGWLDFSYLSGNIWYTKNCAINWNSAANAGDYYFQFGMKTKGFQNITVSAAMLGSYSYYKSQKVEYSLDGTNFTTLGAITLTNSTTWYTAPSGTFSLPSDANDADAVYIRFKADKTSTLSGSGNDGTAIADIYVFADPITVDDGVAPVLLSSNPEANSASSSITGSVVLNFDESVKIVSGTTASLAGKSISPSVASNTISFAYTNLEYSTAYSLTLPAYTVSDLSGNMLASTITLNFTTKERPSVAKKLFDAVVAKDGSGDYTSVIDAISAAPTSRTTPWLIYIKNGTYSGHHNIPTTKPFIHLIGQLRDSVIISDSRLCGGTNAYAVLDGATMVVQASDCYFENLTFENKYGYDNLTGPQALAFYAPGVRIATNNCWLRSYQDTYLSGDRQYHRNSKIEGAVDFIYGAGNVFFDKCTITCNRPDGGYIVAPNHTSETWGYVFSSCTIDYSPRTPKVNIYYGRPWHNTPVTVFLNTKLKVNIYPEGWYKTMGGLPRLWADYGTVDSLGNPVDLSKRISKYYYLSGTDTIKGTAKNYLTDAEAATYTYQNVIYSTSDSWNPRLMSDAPAQPTNFGIDGTTLKWDDMPYTRLYVVFRNDSVLGYTTSAQFVDLKTQLGYSYAVQAVGEYGALSKKAYVKGVQNISISAIATKAYGDASFAISSKVSPSGYNVSYSVLSGPATISGNIVTITGVGQVTIMATQSGNDAFCAASQTITFTVDKGVPAISWASPKSIVYGTALGVAQLNATSSGNGSATYSPASGTLSAGSQTLTVYFAETDLYQAASASVLLTVNKAMPTITWASPLAITYGTALSSTELNATTDGDGLATYTPNAGTMLDAGIQNLKVDFSETANYLAVSTSVQLTVNKAQPLIVWNSPSAITYGTVLSESQLNATFYGNGLAVYSPAIGTKLDAGTQTLTVEIAETANCFAASKSIEIIVNKAVPNIVWNTPSDITYGTLLDNAQLNASIDGGGLAVYSPAFGEKLNAGIHTLSVLVASSSNYEATSASVQLLVKKANPVITWDSPTPITYGTSLSSTQLNATSESTGAATYSPAAGTTLPLGVNVLTVSFAADNNYEAASQTINLVVSDKIIPTIDWNNPAAITYGTVLSSTELNATAPSSLTAVYTPALGTKLEAGTHTLYAYFAGNATYESVTKTVTLVVKKAVPSIDWTTPAAITYGTALSATQLSASVEGNGTATYTPSTGTLNAGTQTLRVDFAESTNYLAASKTVSLVVNKATPTVSWATPSAITYGTALSATQLNASVEGNGSATYTPSTGTLNAGTQTLRVDFAESVNYLAASKTVSLVVNKATPTVSWATPSAITYGTALSATQLNASVEGNGSATYTPSTGTLNAGTQTLRVDFAESANYLAASKTVSLVINKAAPTVSWATPSAITYGTALSATQLNASVEGNGSATYTPSTGTLNAGTQTLRVDFAESTNYLATSKTVSLVVNKATPTVSWATPSAITYGTALSATQLNASVEGNGSATYTPSTGTLNAGTQSLRVDFAESANYLAGSKTVSLVVNKATPTVSWATPAAITYGTALSATQLNASVEGNGSATYTPSTGTLNAGTQTLRVDFAESANYLAASKTVSLVINKATPTVSWAAPAAITYGTALSATQLNASVEGNGSATYTPSTGTLNAGTQTLRVDFAESTNYLAASKTVSLVVNKATPTVSWSTPSAITYGTALSATQLNASVTGNGTATYTPSTGTLNAGTQTLRVDFAESTNYLAASKTVSLVISKATPTVSWSTPSAITYGTALSATQLNASVTGNGTATYTPSTGTLNAGTQTLRVDFAESTNYLAASKTVSLVVNKATPTITWATPATITYGTALSATQLNASVDGNGTAIYTPASGILNAGTQTLRVDFAESANYLAASKTVGLVISKIAPSVSWSTPAAITYGTALNATQLNASAVASSGIVSYSSVSGTILTAGTQTITVTYAADNNYEAASKSVSIVVNKAVLIVSASNLSRVYGDENPTLAISYTGLVNNDKISSVVLPTAACAANAQSDVGYYDITLSGGSASNYSLSLEKGILTVTKAILKVAARNAEMMKGASLPQFKLVFEGFKNSDDSTLVSGSASFSVNMPESESVGDVYNISVDVTGLSATNYSFTASSTFGKLTIVRNTAVSNIDGVQLSMYPNPTKGLVKIVVPQEYEGAVITVTSISGSVVLSQKLESTETALDFSNLPIGNYLVRVSTSKGIVVKQLVKF